MQAARAFAACDAVTWRFAFGALRNGRTGGVTRGPGVPAQAGKFTVIYCHRISSRDYTTSVNPHPSFPGKQPTAHHDIAKMDSKQIQNYREECGELVNEARKAILAYIKKAITDRGEEMTWLNEKEEAALLERFDGIENKVDFISKFCDLPKLERSLVGLRDDVSKSKREAYLQQVRATGATVAEELCGMLLKKLQDALDKPEALKTVKDSWRDALSPLNFLLDNVCGDTSWYGASGDCLCDADIEAEERNPGGWSADMKAALALCDKAREEILEELDVNAVPSHSYFRSLPEGEEKDWFDSKKPDADGLDLAWSLHMLRISDNEKRPAQRPDDRKDFRNQRFGEIKERCQKTVNVLFDALKVKLERAHNKAAALRALRSEWHWCVGSDYLCGFLQAVLGDDDSWCHKKYAAWKSASKAGEEDTECDGVEERLIWLDRLAARSAVMELAQADYFLAGIPEGAELSIIEQLEEYGDLDLMKAISNFVRQCKDWEFVYREDTNEQSRLTALEKMRIRIMTTKNRMIAALGESWRSDPDQLKRFEEFEKEAVHSYGRGYDFLVSKAAPFFSRKIEEADEVGGK